MAEVVLDLSVLGLPEAIFEVTFAAAS